MHDESSPGPQTPEQAAAARPQSGPQPRCVIVGMGASAGGLEVFETFFTQMPPDSGMAFVLVQHLAPDRASLLPALLAQYTRMPVRQVTAATPVEPNHVYVIPPDATLTISGGVLGVQSPPEEPHGHRTPIDVFSARWPPPRVRTSCASCSRALAPMAPWASRPSRSAAAWR
jgi:two-component system, chemotaxis family, CheB/CheR fusion protein